MATLQCSRCGGTRYDTNHRCEKGCGMMTAKDEAQSLRETLERAEAERDALSAHVDRWSSLAIALANKGPFDDQVRDYITELGQESPTTSLARRDARVKAEALESLVSEFSDPCVSVGALDVVEYAAEAAIKHRQQAEDDQ